jgi:hypothetical protein
MKFTLIVQMGPPPPSEEDIIPDIIEPTWTVGWMFILC